MFRAAIASRKPEEMQSILGLRDEFVHAVLPFQSKIASDYEFMFRSSFVSASSKQDQHFTSPELYFLI